MDSRNRSPSVLTVGETKTLAAVADRIFPKTDTPGAVEVGAVDYIEIALTADQRDAVLADFEAGAVPGFKKAAEFFETVRYHVLEGVFCEPQYGGNKDMIGWRLVNFPGQQFVYADAYINKRVDLESVAVDYTKIEEK